MGHQDLHEVQREAQSSIPAEEQFYKELCVEDELESSMAKKELWVLIHNQFNMSQEAHAARRENETLSYMKLQGEGILTLYSGLEETTLVLQFWLLCTREARVYRRYFNKGTQGW